MDLLHAPREGIADVIAVVQQAVFVFDAVFPQYAVYKLGAITYPVIKRLVTSWQGLQVGDKHFKAQVERTLDTQASEKRWNGPGIKSK